ncbi:cytochrome P450 [Phellopilus nigrolimitatus]|nr:cytochrome P450 [Phellopilus nigrolimitatus]
MAQLHSLAPMPSAMNISTTFFDGLSSSEGSNLYGLSLLAGLAGILATVYAFKSTDEDGVPYKAGIPFIGAWDFYSRRNSFIQEGIKKLGNVYSFRINRHKVWVVSGENARNRFFGSKNLHFSEGYVILNGDSPSLKDIKVNKNVEDGDMTSWFGKRLTACLRRDRMARNLTLMFQDLDQITERWAGNGQFDPFNDIYNAVFQLTIRAASCREIADDPAAVKRVMQLYWDMENGVSAASRLLGWFPSTVRKRKQQATADLYLLLKGAIDKRKEEGRREDDSVQVLLDEGDGVNDIIQFVMGALFAGIINTGIMSSWLLLFLAVNPEWKTKVLAELREFVSKYTDSTGSMSSQLAQLPPQVWEEEMAVIDLCLRETIRFVMSGSLLRRVLPAQDGEDMSFEGHKASPGTFLAYSVNSIHHDPEIYPDPLKWDPSRFERGEDKKAHWAFLGWGVGRHPCLGMRFAKLEVKVILAQFLMKYDYSAVDAAGKPVDILPEPDRDNLSRPRPVKPVYIKYQSIVA